MVTVQMHDYAKIRRADPPRHRWAMECRCGRLLDRAQQQLHDLMQHTAAPTKDRYPRPYQVGTEDML